MARPTILNEEMLNKARAYVQTTGDYSNPLLPSIEGLAYNLDVARDTMYAWEKDNKEFSYILEKLRQVQATKLIDKGLNSQYNSTIAKLILSKHGYVEKQETDLTTKGKELPTPILGGLAKDVHSNDSDKKAS